MCSIYSRQQNPYKVWHSWKDMSITQEGNTLNPWKYYIKHFDIIPDCQDSHKVVCPYLVSLSHDTKWQLIDITAGSTLKISAECIYICTNSQNYQIWLVWSPNWHHGWIHIEKWVLEMYNTTLGYQFDPSIRWNIVVSRFHLIDGF